MSAGAGETNGQTSRVTIDDVARLAGVSIATVSRVVNERYGVAPNTVTKVQRAIRELGYESSLVARSLRGSSTNIIGILVADIEPYSAELLKGAARALHDTGWELVVYSAGRHVAGWERRSLSRISGTLIDGTILVTPTVVDVAVNQPTVAVDPHVGGSSLPMVDSENYGGARLATEHLIGLGHRRIGYIGGRADLESARRREAGYLDAMADAGIGVDPDLMRVGDYSEAGAERPTRELLALDERPTAIFAANDLTAIQVLRTAAEHGLTIPDDLSVVGFDNIPESALVQPPLTTIDQPIQQMGQEAVRILLDLLDHPDRPVGEGGATHVTLPTELIVRQSCCPPPT